MKGIDLWLDLNGLTITKTRISNKKTFKCKLTSKNKIEVEDLLLELWWARLGQDSETENELIKKIIENMHENFKSTNQPVVSALNSDLGKVC